jgi:hypothetical protein
MQELLRQLKERLAAATSPITRVRILRLMGYAGDKGAAEALKGFVDDASDDVANAAFDAHCHICDPLCLPEYWHW